jgi:hypothetical protein
VKALKLQSESFVSLSSSTKNNGRKMEKKVNIFLLFFFLRFYRPDIPTILAVNHDDDGEPQNHDLVLLIGKHDFVN